MPIFDLNDEYILLVLVLLVQPDNDKSALTVLLSGSYLRGELNINLFRVIFL